MNALALACALSFAVAANAAPPKAKELRPVPKGLVVRESDLPPLKRGEDPAEVLVRSFGFPTDFRERSHDPYPFGWVRKEDSLSLKLRLGQAAEIQRPKTVLELPYFALMEIAPLKGEDPLIRHLNSGFSYWSRGEWGDALTAMREADLRLGKLPAETILAQAANIALAAFHMALSQREDVYKMPVLEPAGIPDKEISGAAHVAQARGRLLRLARAIDPFQLASNLNTTVSASLFRKQWESPLALSGLSQVKDPFPLPRFQGEALEALVWVRSLALQSLWNATLLNRATALWTYAFDAADVMEGLIEQLGIAGFKEPFPKAPPPVLRPQERALAGAPFVLQPRRLRDLVASNRLMRAIAMLEANDPEAGFQLIDHVIRSRTSPRFSAIAFAFAGHFYFDTSSLRLARRAYAWAEIADPGFFQGFPGELFFGGESSFWAGEFDLARPAFQAFLDVSDDPKFRPWARLRLAQIAQRLNDEPWDKISEIYAGIVDRTPAHPAADDAMVRLFCGNIESASPKIRSQDADTLKAALARLRFDLQLDARTCLLEHALKSASEVPGQLRVRDIPAGVARQRALIEAYKAENPESPYLPLFAPRLETLALAGAAVLALERECGTLMDFALANRGKLDTLSAEAVRQVLPGARWGVSERTILLRCAALSGRVDAWKLAREEGARVAKDGHTGFLSASDGGRIAQTLFEIASRPAVKDAVRSLDTRMASLFALVRKQEGLRWRTAAKQVSARNRVELADDEQFWEKLAVDKLLSFQLALPERQRPRFTAGLRAHLLEDPAKAMEEAQWCPELLAASEKFTAKEWDKLAASKADSEWQALLAADGSAGRSCPARIAQALLSASLRLPSAARDAKIVRPRLDAMGKKTPEASAQWLAYLVRQERLRGMTKEVRAGYDELAKESEDAVVREAIRVRLSREE